MYKVTSDFADARDNNHIYHAGDTFPRDGVEVSPERLAELAGRGNQTGRPVITAVKKARKPKSKATDE